MQGDQFHPSKFIPPSPPFGAIDRPGLLASLAGGLASRLVVVVSPPGYGKTSLLASTAGQWDRLELPPLSVLAWYSLEPSDDDAAVFVEGLVAAARRELPSVGKQTLAVLRAIPDARAELPRLFSVFVQELRDAGAGAFHLFLDDFHLLTDKAILEILEQALKDEASPLRLVLATEKEPGWYLGRLRSSGTFVVVREEQLRFRPDEIEALLRVRLNASPPPAAVDSLFKETRGWPSAGAVGAAVIVATGKPLPFSRLAPTDHGYGRLVKEALGNLPPRVRDGLVRASLLGLVDSRSLGSVAGADHPEEVLAEVERLALPAARVTPESPALRFDPVFRSALERELEATVPPQELRTLRKQVANHHAGMDQWDSAIRSNMLAWAYEDVATFMDRAVPAELSRGHLDTVLRWLRAVPSLTRKGHPRLRVYEAQALMVRRQFSEARVLLATAEPELRSQADSLGLAQRNARWCTLLLDEGRYDEAAGLAEEILGQLPETEHLERADLSWMLARSREMLGALAPAFGAASQGLLAAERSTRQDLVVRALHQLSRLAELMGSYTLAIALAGRHVQRSVLLETEDVAMATSGGLVASMYLERDMPREASKAAELALEANRRINDRASGLSAAVAAARIGEHSSGRAVDAEVTKILGQSGGAPVDLSVERVSARLAAASSLIRSGRGGDAAAWARDAEAEAAGIAHRPLLERSRLLMTLARSGILGLRLLARVRLQRDAYLSYGDRRWQSAGHLVAAERYQRLGLGWRARANLKSFLELAVDEGYVGLPLGLPSHTERLFVLAAHDGVYPEVAGALLGVDQEVGHKLLGPLHTSKEPLIRARAETAEKGLESGSGRASSPRFSWPAVAEDPGAPVAALLTLGETLGFVEGEPVGWPSSDARTLAAYFVARRGEAVSREELLSDLWPEVTQQSAYIRLQVALYQLRESFGPGYPAIDLHGESKGSYIWDGSTCFIDVERFRALSAEIAGDMANEGPPVLSGGTVRLLEQAVALYRGEFLAGLQYPWCEGQREELRGQLLRSARLLMDHYLSLKEWRDVIRHGLKSLRSDPLQEDVVRDLMVSFFRIGDRESVMSQYREVKRVLAKERGVWPSEETRQLRVRLLGR